MSLDEAPVGVESRPQDLGEEPVIRIDEARRRSLRRWAVGAGTAVAIAVGGMAVTLTPVFHAENIRVGGAEHLSERQIRRLAGVDGGTNVFALDERVVVRRLERSPWIADAVVTTSWPSTVSIEVTEREPVAMAKNDAGFVLLAEDGSVLGPAHGAALPEIRALEALGDQLAPPVTGAIVVTSTNAAAEFGPAIRSAIEAIVVQPDATLTLELRNGVTVAYGEGDDLEAKAKALGAILAYAAEEGKTLISVDLRTPAAPTARFVGSPVVTTVDAGRERERDPDDRSKSGDAPTPSPGAAPSP